MYHSTLTANANQGYLIALKKTTDLLHDLVEEVTGVERLSKCFFRGVSQSFIILYCSCIDPKELEEIHGNKRKK